MFNLYRIGGQIFRISTKKHTLMAGLVKTGARLQRERPESLA